MFKKLLSLLFGLTLALGVMSFIQRPAYAATLPYLEINFGSPSATLPLDRFMKHKFPIKNTTDQAQTVSFAIYVKETNQEVVGWPQPQTLYFGPGETIYVETFLDENWGKLDKDKPGNQDRTVEWRFIDEKTKVRRTETVTYKITVLKPDEITGPLKISGQVIGSNSKPVTDGTVMLSTGNYSLYAATAADGTYAFDNVPERTDWYLKAEGGTRSARPNFPLETNPNAPGQIEPKEGEAPNMPMNPHNTPCDPPPAPCNPPTDSMMQPNVYGDKTDLEQAPLEAQNIPLDGAPDEMMPLMTNDGGGLGVAFAFVKPGESVYNLQLRPATATAEFIPQSEVTGDIGIWKGDVDAAETSVLLINGMENWQTQDKTKSKLYLYSLTGEKKWEYEMGFEGWGADLSQDGKYAAFTTSNSTHDLGVIDAATGKPVWVKKSTELGLKNITMPGEGGGIDSKETKISDDDKYVAFGHGGGDLVLLSLSDGKLVWNTNLKGQVRGITFSSDSAFIYAGSGDGNAYKVNASDGTIVWKTDIGSWPFTNGWKLSKDGTYLGSASKVGEVTIIETETGKQLWQSDQQGNASWLDFSPDGRYVFAGGGGQGANTLYEVATGKKLWKLEGYSHEGRFSADGNYILMGDQNVRILDLNGNVLTDTTSRSDPGGGRSGQFAYISNDGTKLIFTRRDMDKTGAFVVFASGSIVPATPSPTPAVVVDTDAPSNGSDVAMWIGIGVAVAAAIGSGIALKRKKDINRSIPAEAPPQP